MTDDQATEALAGNPRVRLYVLLNRIWFFGYFALVMVLSWVGVDLLLVFAVSAATAVVAITLLNPRRSRWGPEVHDLIGNRQLARKWAR